MQEPENWLSCFQVRAGMFCIGNSLPIAIVQWYCPGLDLSMY